MNTAHQQHLIEIATVIQVHPRHSLVKVSSMGKPSGWLVVLQQVNTFKKQFTALRTDEQVMVLAGKYVLRGVYNQRAKEPGGSNDHTDITQYEDGTRIEYNSQTHQLTVTCVGNTKLQSPDIELIGSIKIVGDIEHIGTLDNTAGINTDSDCSASGISLVKHSHPQNSGNHFGGGASTGKPQ